MKLTRIDGEVGTPMPLEGLVDGPVAPSVGNAFLLRIGPGTESDSRPLSAQDLGNERGFIVGFSSVCTHMGCLLVWGRDKADHVIEYSSGVGGHRFSLTCGPCPCHGTTFDLLKSGLVIMGPATQNLPQLALIVHGDELEITGFVSNPPPQHETWPLAAS